MAVDELEVALARVRAEAAAAWPAFRAPTVAFDEHVASLVERDASRTRELLVPELYLAFACAAGDPAALAVLEKGYLPDLRPVLGRMGLASTDIDETLQVMREELLLPRAGGPTRILGYAGRGSLKGWLRAVAARTGLRVKAPPGGKPPLELDETAHAGGIEDMELEYMKKQYGDAFHAAFGVAVAGLPAKDRLLLKQRFKYRLTVEELGRQHGVNAGTISRWVATARDRLAGDTRAEMVRHLGVARGDVSSIIRLIQSQLDVSLSALSVAAPPPAPEA